MITLTQLLNGKKLHNCGTSRTFGALDTNNTTNRWTKLLATLAGGIEDNDGVSGSTIVANLGVFYDKARIPVYDNTFGAMTIEFGTNELGIAGGNAVPSQFRTALIAFVEHAINVKGWPANKLIIQNFYWPGCANVDMIPAYLAIFEEVALTYDTVYADYYTRFATDPNINSYFKSDLLHENELGMQKIAEWYNSLDYTPYSNGIFIALDNEGKRWETYGDSNLYKVVEPQAVNRWSQFVCEDTNGIDWNGGVSGQGWLNPGNTFNKTSISVFNSAVNKYLVLANGTNDIGVTEVVNGSNQLITGATFKAKLLEIVDYAHNTKGWAYSSIVLPTINLRVDVNSKPAQQAEFNQAIKEIALLRGTVYIDLLTEFNKIPNVASLIEADGVHYGDFLHRKIADIYIAANYAPYTGQVIINPPVGKNPPIPYYTAATSSFLTV